MVGAPSRPRPPPGGGRPRGPHHERPRWSSWAAHPPPDAGAPAMPRVQRPRRAVAAVELALVLPFLVFMFLVAVDFCRVFYFSQVVTTGARNGALYLSDPDGPNQSRYPDLTAAVRGDADPSFASQLTVTSTSGTASVGKYTRVTVSFPFTCFTNYPGIPQTLTLTRTALVRPAPAVPK